MKIGALLLGLFVLFLSVKSVVAPIALLTEVDACCKKEKAHDQEAAENHGTDCDDLCSPFQPCCAYVAFSVTMPAITVPKAFPTIETKLPLYQVSSYSNYSADFWQPPKLA